MSRNRRPASRPRFRWGPCQNRGKDIASPQNPRAPTRTRIPRASSRHLHEASPHRVIRRDCNAGAENFRAAPPGTPPSGGMNSLQSPRLIAVFVIAFIVQAFRSPLPRWKRPCWLATTCWWTRCTKDTRRFGDGSCLIAVRRRHHCLPLSADPRQHFVKRVVAVSPQRSGLYDGRASDGVAQDEPTLRFIRKSSDRIPRRFSRRAI